MTEADVRLDLLIVTCAVSAGIHAALVEGHFREGTAAGTGFVVATVLLAAFAVVLTRSPSTPAVLGAAALFAGLIGAYALAVTTGMPVLHPEVEPIEGLALFTKAIEALGLVVALSLTAIPQPKGALT